MNTKIEIRTSTGEVVAFISLHNAGEIEALRVGRALGRELYWREDHTTGQVVRSHSFFQKEEFEVWYSSPYNEKGELCNSGEGKFARIGWILPS